jgi:hypothetical protein
MTFATGFAMTGAFAGTESLDAMLGPGAWFQFV